MKMDQHPAASIPPDHAMTRKPVVRNPGRRAFLAGTATLPTLWLAGCGGTQSDLPTAPPVGNPTPPPAMPLNGPRGLHVSLTGDAASSRAVTWFTDGHEAGPSVMMRKQERDRERRADRGERGGDRGERPRRDREEENA